MMDMKIKLGCTFASKRKRKMISNIVQKESTPVLQEDKQVHKKHLLTLGY